MNSSVAVSALLLAKDIKSLFGRDTDAFQKSSK